MHFKRITLAVTLRKGSTKKMCGRSSEPGENAIVTIQERQRWSREVDGLDVRYEKKKEKKEESGMNLTAYIVSKYKMKLSLTAFSDIRLWLGWESVRIKGAG